MIDLPTSDSHSLPVWSSDDSHVSVAMPDGLLIGDGSGADLRNVGAFPRVSSWSFDGSRFAFLRDGDAWIARSNGTDARNLTGFEFGGAGPMALSPDGETLAVLQGGTALWLVGVDGTRRHVDLGPDVAPDWARLHWSPDGQRLAVETQSVTGRSDGRYLAVLARHDRTNGIDVANADGSGRVTVTTGPVEGADDLAWVPRS